MHDIDGPEIYLNHRREWLMQEAKHQRTVAEAKRTLASRPGLLSLYVEVHFRNHPARRLQIELN